MASSKKAFRLVVAAIPVVSWVLLTAEATSFPGRSLQSQSSQKQEDFERGAHHVTEQGVKRPLLTRRIAPKYPEKARSQRIEGDVTLDVVVLDDGSVGRSRIVKSLDKRFGIDDAAVAAVAQWRFKPGTLNNRPIAVIMPITLTFKLPPGSSR